MFGDNGASTSSQLQLGVRTVLKVQPPRRRSIAASIGCDNHDVVPVSKANEWDGSAPTRNPADRRENADLTAPPPVADSPSAHAQYRHVEPGHHESCRPDAFGVGPLIHLEPFDVERAPKFQAGSSWCCHTSNRVAGYTSLTAWLTDGPCPPAPIGAGENPICACRQRPACARRNVNPCIS